MNDSLVTPEECIKLIEAHLKSNLPKGTPLILTDNYWKVVLGSLRKYNKLRELYGDPDEIIWDDLPELKVGDIFKRGKDRKVELFTVVSVINKAAGEYAVTLKSPYYTFTYRPKEDSDLEMIFRMEREAELIKDGFKYTPVTLIWDRYHSSGRERDCQ